MALAVVQRAHNSGPSDSETSLTVSVSATSVGSLLALAVVSGTFNDPGSVTDSTGGGGNGWSNVITSGTNGSGFFSGLWLTTAASPASVTSVTFSLASRNGPIVAAFWEISGANNTSALDVGAFDTAGGNPYTTGTTSTPSESADLAIGMIAGSRGTGSVSSPAFTSGGGTFSTTATNSQATFASLLQGDLVLSSATAQAMTETVDFSTASLGVIGLIKVPGSSARKTIAGLAAASVKTIDALAVASVKKVNGLT